MSSKRATDRAAILRRGIGHLAIVIAGAPMACWGSTTVTTAQAFDYDPATGLLTKSVVEPTNSDLCLVSAFQVDNFGHVTMVTERNCNGSATSIAGGVTEAAAPSGQAAFVPRQSSAATYTTDQRFIQAQTNALNYSEQQVYDPRFGARTSRTDVNSITSSVTYDGLARKSLETHDDGTKARWTFGFCLNPDTAAFPTWPAVPSGWASAACQAVTLSNANSVAQKVYPVYFEQSTPLKADGVTQNGPYVRIYHDSLGRVIRTETQGFDASGTAPLVYADTSFNRRGQVAAKSNPYFADGTGGTTGTTAYTYDARVRVTSMAEPNAAGGSVTTNYYYSGLTTTIVDPRGNSSSLTKNYAGWPANQTDAKGTLTREYDPLGKEVRTTDAQQNVASNSYDVRGRRTDAFDPDMGHWIYVYDALGELVQQTDAKSQSITMKYDLLGRMTSRTDPDLTSYWHYDKYNGESSVTGSACGKSLLNVCELRTDHGYDDKFVYDSAGRAVSEALTVGASQYVSTSGYDSASGRKIQGTYPSGVSVTYAYTALGYAWKALDGRTGAEIWRGTSRSALGKWLQFVHGNGVSTTNTYFPDGLVNTAQTGAGSAIESFMYAYDKNGNLSNRMDLSTGVSSSYAYDELNRLTGETRSGASLASAQTIAWTFDAIGNMTSRTEGGVTNTYNYNSSGVGSLRPHAVADVSGAVNDALVPVYNYDANGNMTGGGGRTVAWTTANMVQSLSKAGKVVSFLYGPERERVQEVLTLNGSAQKTTIYMNPKAGAGLWYEDESGVAGIEKRHYVSVDGMTVAVIICRATPCTNTVNTATQYWHNDHLGSLTAVTDAGGGISERMAYEPFGKRRNVDGRTDVYGTLDPATGRGFTQHEHIDEVGLINMNGRVFDPALGRFMSADPNVPHPDQTQSYNRYSYVQNNPLAMVDPTGFADLPVGVGDTQTGTGGTCSLWCYSPINWLSQLFGIKPGGDAATYGSGQPNDASSTGDSSNERNLQSLMEGERGNRFRDIHHRFDAASRNRDIKAMTAIVNEYIDLYGNYWNPEASMGLVRMGNMLIRAEHDAGMDVDPQVIRAASAGLLASGMVAGIGPDLRGSGGAAKGESLIYRAASGTPASMTPRVVDAKGLSAADSLANALPGKNQVIDTSKFKSLCAICDNPATGHVSITPKDMSQMQGWINSRGGAEIHPFTQELMDAVIGTVKK